MPPEAAGIYGNLCNDLNYQLRLVDRDHFDSADSAQSQLLLLRTFNVVPFREVLRASLEYFPSHRIHLLIQDSGREQIPDSARCCSYTIPDNLRRAAQLLCLGLPAGEIRYALVPYNGGEMIQYYAFLRALRDLQVEMARYLELVPEHESLRRKYAQANWFC